MHDLVIRNVNILDGRGSEAFQGDVAISGDKIAEVGVVSGSGEQEIDGGTLALEKNVRIGFLKQDLDFVQGRTVLEEAYEAFTDIKALEKKLEKFLKIQKY